jgi:hypothetical protein
MLVEIDQSPIRKHIGFLFHHSLCSRSIDFLLQHDALPPKETDRYMTILPSPPLHYPCITNWIKDESFRLALSPGEKKAKHKHNPKTRTFNNPKTQTTTDHNNAETQNTSPHKGKNKKRQLTPPLSSLSNNQQEQQQQQQDSTKQIDADCRPNSAPNSARHFPNLLCENILLLHECFTIPRGSQQSRKLDHLEQSRRERRQQKHSLVKRSSSSIIESIVGIVCYLVPTYVYMVPGSMLDIATYLPSYLPTYLHSSVANLIGHNFRKWGKWNSFWKLIPNYVIVGHAYQGKRILCLDSL